MITLALSTSFKLRAAALRREARGSPSGQAVSM